MMDDKTTVRLTEAMRRVSRVGIAGFGSLGQEVRRLAQSLHVDSILVWDPAAAQEEIEDIGDHFFALWGNGMGGCPLTGEELVTFLPFECLRSVQLLIVTCAVDDCLKQNLEKLPSEIPVIFSY